MADCAEGDGATVCLSTGANAAAKAAGAAINANAMTDAGIIRVPTIFVSTVDFEWCMGKNAAAAPAIEEHHPGQCRGSSLERCYTGSVLDRSRGGRRDRGVHGWSQREDSGTQGFDPRLRAGHLATGNKFGLGAGTHQYMIKQAVAGYPANVNYSSLAAESGNIVDFQVWPGNWGMNTKPTISWSAVLTRPLWLQWRRRRLGCPEQPKSGFCALPHNRKFHLAGYGCCVSPGGCFSEPALEAADRFEAS